MFDIQLINLRRQTVVTALCAAMAAMLLMMMLALVSYIALKGGRHFLPQTIYQLEYVTVQGVHNVAYANLQWQRADRLYFVQHLGNSRHQDIVLNSEQLLAQHVDENIAQLNLIDGQRLFAKVRFFSERGRSFAAASSEASTLQTFVQLKQHSDALSSQLQQLRSTQMAEVQQTLADYKRLGVSQDAPANIRYQRRYRQLIEDITDLKERLAAYQIILQLADGTQKTLQISHIDNLFFPNQLSLMEQVWQTLKAVGAFLSDAPNQTNTSGGVFPALFGTVLMVLLMTLIVAPLGVIAALYLHEYASANWITSMIRSIVTNLASVPSIVYGVFGLGLLVYQLGGSLDRWFFSDYLPTPTFGTPGLFWAALTMAMLTLPVVIVATEEGLRQVPDALRKGSYALGATQSETIWRTVLPIASPGIMTGVILAIARGAGEVAPIILVGAVKFAPALPIDSDFPFVHFERQFMHLGVLVYDGAFHGGHLGQENSYMFAACLLLLLLVLVLNLVAVLTRSRLRKQYTF